MSSLFEQATSADAIQRAFEVFDADHPEVWTLFRRLAAEVRGRGWTRYSADALLHRIRWHYHVEQGDAAFKINDHFSSRYARKLVEADPSYADFFELRRLSKERTP